MAEEGFMWIYLIFFLIPLARIIPRMVRKWQNKENSDTEKQYNQYQRTESFENAEIFEKARTKDMSESFEREERIEKPQDKKMQVLGEINRGIKDFNQIQKNTGVDSQKLENILKDFEDKGLMRVIKKDGVLGSKIEICPTEKGYKEFHK